MDYISAHSRRFSFFVDIIIIYLSFHITYGLTTSLVGHPLFPYSSVMYYKTYFITGFSWMVSVLILAYYPSRRIISMLYESYMVARICILGLIVLTLMSFVFKQTDFSRLFIGSFSVVAFLFMIIVRGVIRLLLNIRRRAGFDQKTHIIVGSGVRARQYLNGVKTHRGNGIQVIGHITDRKDKLDVPCLGTLNDLRQVLIAHPVDGVVVTLPVTHPKLEQVLNECEIQGAPVEFMLDGLTSMLSSSILVHGMGTSRLVISSVPHSPTQLWLKRVTDVVAGVLLLTILSPILLAIAIAIKLDDGGPVTFSQERVGLHGRRFRIHKFRSMRVNAEEIKAKLMAMNEMSGPVFKMRNDPRVTRVGKFLRKTSLDELPQLWDVVVGHMSLVGPRPPLPSEVDLYDVEYRRRLSVKPGITCLWQVSGRNNIDFEQWMALDMEYIETWSYMSDWKILFRTIPAVLRRDGAS